MPAEVENMVSVRETPWHRLGKVVENELTAEEALRESGLDWEVEKMPVFTMTGEDEYTAVPDRYATVRSTDRKALGVVGKQYTVLQNRDAFAFADSLVDDGSAKYETAGSLRDGKLVWLMMKVPKDILIAGEDAVDLYLALRNSHDGTSAVTAMVTPVRIVCQNTLNLAFGQARTTWSVRHVGSMDGRLEEARRALELTFEYADEFQTEAEALVKEQLSDNAFERIVSELTDIDRHVEGMIDMFRNSPNIDNFRNTKWAGVNAVGEYWEHGRDHRSEESRLRSTMNGKARTMRDRSLELISAV